jgi:hypothetical protein
MEYFECTYRIVTLGGQEKGQTAATQTLAKLVPPDVDRSSCRLGMERTEWVDKFGKPSVLRTVLIDAESKPNEWALGV